ncbi:hypothetical protein Vadar_012523 [Vaccinium darrowii]|uniref:Uncharacterized protein n=1 Tax=Vaccinium darrowii TaxID=229202 RepID=A0ACB7WZZ3_9ERIC|nr:hypothetical protein Vadar_012523 [Vaccinium darrowii]
MGTMESLKFLVSSRYIRDLATLVVAYETVDKLEDDRISDPSTIAGPDRPIALAETDGLTASKVYAPDSLSQNIKPPPINDGTPNESLVDLFVRVIELICQFLKSNTLRTRFICRLKLEKTCYIFILTGDRPEVQPRPEPGVVQNPGGGGDDGDDGAGGRRGGRAGRGGGRGARDGCGSSRRGGGAGGSRRDRSTGGSRGASSSRGGDCGTGGGGESGSLHRAQRARRAPVSSETEQVSIVFCLEISML